MEISKILKFTVKQKKIIKEKNGHVVNEREENDRWLTVELQMFECTYTSFDWTKTLDFV